MRSPALRAARRAMVAVGSMQYLGLKRRRMITGAEGRGYVSDKLCRNIDSSFYSGRLVRDVNDGFITRWPRDSILADHTRDTAV